MLESITLVILSRFVCFFRFKVFIFIEPQKESSNFYATPYVKILVFELRLWLNLAIVIVGEKIQLGISGNEFVT